MKIHVTSDAELNTLVATRVAGWVLNPEYRSFFGGAKCNPYWGDEKGCPQFDGPDFIYSIDALLPLLNKCGSWRLETVGDGFWVRIERPQYAEEWAKTPTVAICLALLKAHGVDVEFKPIVK